MDQAYERLRARALTAVAAHESGLTDLEELRAILSGVHDEVDEAHPEARAVLLGAGLLLEYAEYGCSRIQGYDPETALEAMRTSVRTVLSDIGGE